MSRPPLLAAFFGDSLTQGVGDETGLGWVGRLANQWNEKRELTWFNLGVRGNTALELSRRAESELSARLMPGVETRVVVSIGTNDASLYNKVPRVSVQRSVELMERTWDGLQKKGKPFWIGPVPVAEERLDIEHAGEVFSFVTARVAELSQAYARMAEKRGIPYLDLVEAFSGVDFSKYETADGIHPQARGYEELYRVISGWEALAV
jgi:lysophospholipase L1-like esterase